MLLSVAATSRDNVWAVGYLGLKTLILHWNGRVWRRLPSPSPGYGAAANDGLAGVSASSANNAWAVGWTSQGAGTLILHWDGHS